MKLAATLLACALVVALSACGDAAGTTTTGPSRTTTTAPDTTTTTAPSTTTTEPADRASETLAAIAAAAEAGDLDRLARIALSGRSSFTASFGHEFTTSEELAAFWRELDADGVGVAGTIAALVSLPTHTTFATDVDGDRVEIHVAPRLLAEDASDADLAQARAALGDRVDDWFADGMYLGWRLGVDANGDWRFFVFGD